MHLIDNRPASALLPVTMTGKALAQARGLVIAADGETRPASEWGGRGGCARNLRDARATAHGRQVGAVVRVQGMGMKEAWCLVASNPEAAATAPVDHYTKC